MNNFLKNCRFCGDNFSKKSNDIELSAKTYFLLPPVRKFNYCQSCVKYYNDCAEISKSCHDCKKMSYFHEKITTKNGKINYYCKRCLDKPHKPHKKMERIKRIKMPNYDYNDLDKYDWNMIDKL